MRAETLSSQRTFLKKHCWAKETTAAPPGLHEQVTSGWRDLKLCQIEHFLTWQKMKETVKLDWIKIEVRKNWENEWQNNCIVSILVKLGKVCYFRCWSIGPWIFFAVSSQISLNHRHSSFLAWLHRQPVVQHSSKSHPIYRHGWSRRQCYSSQNGWTGWEIRW